MHLRLIAARAATVVALSCASVLVTSLVVYADANPNNHGHHYGQLKHQRPPVPAPQPPPATKPNPPAVVPIVSHTNVAIAQTSPPPVSNGVTLPLPGFAGQTAPQRAGAAVHPYRDPNLWIVEALLPALLIVWLILLALSRALRKRTPQAKEQAT